MIPKAFSPTPGPDPAIKLPITTDKVLYWERNLGVCVIETESDDDEPVVRETVDHLLEENAHLSVSNGSSRIDLSKTIQRTDVSEDRALWGAPNGSFIYPQPR